MTSNNNVLITTSIIAISILCAFHLYIIAFHRLNGYADFSVVSRVLMSNRISSRCRKTTGEGAMQCLPNVMIIGASKCGTTSLIAYLSQHKNVEFVARRIHKVDHHKEVHRFDRNTYGMAIKAVELVDEWASSPFVSNDNITVVHYTPHYIYAPTVPFEMKRFYPHAMDLKIVIILREPVARAWSSYWFYNSHLLQGEDKGWTWFLFITRTCILCSHHHGSISLQAARRSFRSSCATKSIAGTI